MCATPVPTEEPTVEPTPTPTEVPTTLPPTTDEPSFAPTPTPTEEPTAVPTPTPTETPTEAPTATPTRYPTPTSDFCKLKGYLNNGAQRTPYTFRFRPGKCDGVLLKRSSSFMTCYVQPVASMNLCRHVGCGFQGSDCPGTKTITGQSNTVCKADKGVNECGLKQAEVTSYGGTYYIRIETWK